MLSTLLLIFKALGLTFKQLTIHLSLVLTPRLHRLTYRSVPHPKNIVIIGASFAGYHAARRLASTVPTGYRVVIIERNSHFQLTWVLPRFSVVGGHEHKAFIPYKGYLAPVAEGAYTWVNGSVGSVIVSDGDAPKGQGKVVLGESGEEIEFEYLVVATGAVASGLPSRVGVMTKVEGMKVLVGEQERIRAARDVVVLGGGAAGVEMAGDVKERYPEKNVTLVHSRERLLNRGYGEGLSRRALEGLEGLGVTVLLGERVVDGDHNLTGEVRLKSGGVVKCDCLVKCVGQRPNSGLVAKVSPLSVTESGHIRVRPSLQLADEACSRIYAAGDVIEVNTVQNARGALQQAEVVARNIVRAIKGKRLVVYRPNWWESATKLTLGLKKSVMYMSDGSAELIVSTKSKEELDSARVWKYFGLKPFNDTSKEKTI
ncbi:NAD(P)/FAD-dependent oxidoreductase [Aspergillus homomorphus CBS 101889]|uniref:Putative mercuric reductase n=1 Tax=Aspergillus homomorphus (strain CBS 101889) TaxID=1450537 RepID=A0A395HUK7_ASPHC|nr:putative mercuric reductase [Aspergillus homomorphus CBS 101889]RAL11216.1 putative mercuric reductase [Aspergillus homomorphus CBS 101889]